MMTNKTDLVKQVNWALRAREPIWFRAVSDVTAKWKPAGYEVRFDSGCAVIAHFEGRIVAIAWQQMGDVERHSFAKDCGTRHCASGGVRKANLCQLLQLDEALSKESVSKGQK